MALMDACSLDHMQKMEVNGSGTGQGIDGNSIGAAAASDDPFDLADMLKEEQKPEEKEQKCDPLSYPLPCCTMQQLHSARNHRL